MTSPPHPRQHERGLNLVSLMVGTSIALLLLVAMLQLSKNVAQTSNAAGQSARGDSQLSSALLTAAFAVQSAGFGMENPSYGIDLVLLREAQLSQQKLTGTLVALHQAPSPAGSESVAFMGNALIWRSKSQALQASTQCEALLALPESAASGASMNTWGLFHLSTAPTVSCDGAVLQADWAESRPLASEVSFKITATKTACTPFGHSQGAKDQNQDPAQTEPPPEHVFVTLSALSSSGIVFEESFCLHHFHVVP